jgi:hypothetical protein
LNLQTVHINTSSLALTFRYTNTRKRWLIEGGSQFTKFVKIKQNNFDTGSSFSETAANYNYENNFKNYTSFVLGGGVFIRGVVVSLRFTASLNSITQAFANPVKDGYYNNPQINNSYSRNYAKDAITRHDTYQITIEYYLPFFKYKRDSRGKGGFSLKPIKNSYYWGTNDPYN